ncbi:DUF1269 domain-containing protein [Streptomyces sp. Tu 2975]|uniref:DUF1269 domain-containing protein n=1 Tax=Streptomyces sp. Tu 2975 TaxID=2676871 RepID=UPI001FC9134C|nr:DUF1269 domain-containing protein [Streptomyces sp. Tu 2975]
MSREHLVELEGILVERARRAGGSRCIRTSTRPPPGRPAGRCGGDVIGMLFLVPLLGAAVGAGAGALSDTGGQ